MLDPSLSGMRIIFAAHALEETEERLFPASRYRSARVRKKLIKRYGGEFRKRPCIFKTAAGTIIAHPSYRTALRNL